MGFYEDIAPFYDYIFPASEVQLNLMRKYFGDPPKSVLDIACGNGNYAVELAKFGYDVTGIDMDEAMIKEAKLKAGEEGVEIKFVKGNMMDTAGLMDKQFDATLCIGNSLSHLRDMDEIGEFFKRIVPIIKKDGIMIIQIINFDRVLYRDITSLPEIYNDAIGITFTRTYEMDEGDDDGRILFKTWLQTPEKEYTNEIHLFPILFDDLKASIKNAGLAIKDCFGNFHAEEYQKHDSYSLVMVLTKA